MVFRRALLVSFIIVGCKDPSAAPVDASPAPPAPPPVKKEEPDLPKEIQHDWFTMRVPRTWTEQKLDTDKKRAMFALELTSGPMEPDMLFLVLRPRSLAEKTNPGDPAVTQALAASLTGGENPVDLAMDVATLAGQPAFVITEHGKKPSGEPTLYRTWGAFVEHQVVTVICGGAADGIAKAATLCPAMVSSFAVGKPKPMPPPGDVPLPSKVARRAAGPVTLEVPGTWEKLEGDWLSAPMVAGWRAKPASEGPFEVAVLGVATERGAVSAESLARDLKRGADLKVVSGAPFHLGLGEGRETERTDQVGTTTIAYDVVVGGVGYEITCIVPDRWVETYRPVCRQAAKSARVAPRQ